MTESYKCPSLVLNDEARLLNVKSLVGPVLDIGCSNTQRKKQFRHTAYFSLDILAKYQPSIIGDAHNLPFKNESVKVVLCLSLLEHVNKPSLAMSEIDRVLKKRGFLFITVPFLYPVHDRQDFCRFTLGYFEKNLENYIILKKERRFPGFFSTILSWGIPATYNLPFLTRKVLQTIVQSLLLLTTFLDFGRDRFYAHVFIRAQKI